MAADPVTSLFGALGKYIYDNGIDLSDISRIMLTGVGSAYVDGNLYGLPTGKVEEFTANAIGAGHGSGLDRMVVVSMGTGTSFISVDHGKFTHLGGLGIGGGTLQGLSKIIFKASDLDYVISMAMRGTVSSVDLQIGDICREELPGLPLDATASNFGKADTAAQAEDVAAGVINMILRRKCGQFHIFGDRNQGFRTHRESVAASSVQISVRQDRQAVRPGFPYSGAYPLQNGARCGIVCLER